MERLTIRPSEDTQLAKFLHARVVGQEQAVASIVAQFDKLLANMNDPSRPIASLLFLGPTGVGKTKIVEAFCEYLFGEGQKPIKVNCGEYIHDHQIAKLIGSPAGYMGSEQVAVLRQEQNRGPLNQGPQAAQRHSVRRNREGGKRGAPREGSERGGGPQQPDAQHLRPRILELGQRHRSRLHQDDHLHDVEPRGGTS